MEQHLSRVESPPTPKKELLNARQVAARLEYANANTIYYLMKVDETFPRPIKLGRNSRWHVEDVDAWFESKIGPARADNALRLRQSRKGGGK